MTIDQIRQAQQHATKKAADFLFPSANFEMGSRYEHIAALLEIAIQLAIMNERNGKA